MRQRSILEEATSSTVEPERATTEWRWPGGHRGFSPSRNLANTSGSTKLCRSSSDVNISDDDLDVTDDDDPDDDPDVTDDDDDPEDKDTEEEEDVKEEDEDIGVTDLDESCPPSDGSGDELRS